MLDRGPRRGPLHGVPIGVKDVIHTRGMPTRYNSPIHDEPAPTPDAACVAMLRAAGALILGKTTTVEFAAIGKPADTRNPKDPRRTPGGSSSGSAAAVADGHVPIALGTQTGGSMIRPASFCGAWAMKPTWGLVSNEGCKRLAPTLDTIGWFARSLADLGLMLDVLDPSPPREPFAEDDFHVALCRTPMWDRADAATQDAFAEAERALRSRGARLTVLDADALLQPLPALQRLIMLAEGRVSFQPERHLLEGAMADMANGVDVASAAELGEAYNKAAVARAKFDHLVSPFDAVLTPSVIGEAPLGLASTGDFLFNGLWTLLHVPCINVPRWSGPYGLPIGLTLTGPRYSDRRIFDSARLLADAAPTSSLSTERG